MAPKNKKNLGHMEKKIKLCETFQQNGWDHFEYALSNGYLNRPFHRRIYVYTRQESIN